jgi:hypothetical protein
VAAGALWKESGPKRASRSPEAGASARSKS